MFSVRKTWVFIKSWICKILVLGKLRQHLEVFCVSVQVIYARVYMDTWKSGEDIRWPVFCPFPICSFKGLLPEAAVRLPVSKSKQSLVLTVLEVVAWRDSHPCLFAWDLENWTQVLMFFANEFEIPGIIFIFRRFVDYKLNYFEFLLTIIIWYDIKVILKRLTNDQCVIHW